MFNKFLSIALIFPCGVVFAGQIEIVYKDRMNNLSWSRALPNTYTNGCKDNHDGYAGDDCTIEMGPDGTEQVGTDDSDAVKACASLGARLPTQAEYESLIRKFVFTESNYGPCLTEVGKKDMQMIFKDMDGPYGSEMFWSSTIYKGRYNELWGWPVESAGIFGVTQVGDDACNGKYNGLYSFHRVNRISVRCVVDR